TIIYTNPKAEQQIFTRVTDIMPDSPKEIKPHPDGLELGYLTKMLKFTDSRTLQAFLTTDLSRIGAGTAKDICERAALLPKMKPHDISLQQAEKLLKGMRDAKIIAPPTDCISPIGKELLEKGLRKEIKAEFYHSVTRSPSVYRGNPFVIEVAIAYGGELPADGSVNLLRFANRVPLLYQQGACAITECVQKASWRPYGLQQSGNNMPQGPVVIAVHLASVWAPFTSEAKEAVAHYPEIMKEIRLALQECGRVLGSYVRKKRRVHDELKKRGYIEKYIPHIGIALKDLLGLKDTEEKQLCKILEEVLEKTRQSVELEKAEHDDDEERLGLEFDEVNES
ncbi:DNA topoisomerase VI subunit B, partial [Candidatus Woesearchaeota archaeon CG11_big_fil_rev_8_21_14_0_20_57_5]